MRDLPTMRGASPEIANGDLRLWFEPGGDGRMRFETSVLDRDGSPRVASRSNILAGGGLDLAADHVTSAGEGLQLSGTGQGRGPEWQPVAYSWTAVARPYGSGIEFEATIDLDGPLANPPA